MLDSISLPVERQRLQVLPDGLHWDRILFCAKEATYKAWFPLTHRWLGFEDAHIAFEVDADGTSGTFSSRILIDPAVEKRGAVDGARRALDGDRRTGADGDRVVNAGAPGIVVVDKPGGMTSHDVVGRVPRIFGTRKVGHAGTLDPMGHRCWWSGSSRPPDPRADLGTSKSYDATIRWARRHRPMTPKANCCSLFRLTRLPIPPSTTRWLRCAAISTRSRRRSARSRSAARGYQLARAGRRSNWRPAGSVSTGSTFLAIRRAGELPDVVDLDVTVDCSSGTYIRALARDLGKRPRGVVI